jgi:hypothetical protein
LVTRTSGVADVVERAMEKGRDNPILRTNHTPLSLANRIISLELFGYKILMKI